MNQFSDQNLLTTNFSDNRNVLLLIGHLRTIKYLIKYQEVLQKEKKIAKELHELILKNKDDSEVRAQVRTWNTRKVGIRMERYL